MLQKGVNLEHISAESIKLWKNHLFCGGEIWTTSKVMDTGRKLVITGIEFEGEVGILG